MKSAVESLNPTRVKLTVEVPFEELRPSLDAAYKTIARQINVPGFRKGRVPPQIVDQRIGRAAVLDQAVNDAIPQLYYAALQENELQALGQPEIEVTTFEDGTELAFTAELDVRPQIELPEYEGLEAQVDDVEVTDADVDEQIESLRERFGSLSSVDRPAAEGDYVTIDLTASKDGALIEEAQASGLSYKVGSGTMLEGLDDAVTGLSAGESKTFVSQLVGGEMQGQDVDVEVTVQAVKEQELPELDEEFAQQASEFDTVEELRADLARSIERSRRLEQAAAARDSVLEKLLSLVDVPLPEAAVAEELEARRASIREQLTYAGMTEQQYLDAEGQTQEEFDADLEKRVRDALTAQFVLDELAKKEQLSVDEAELSEHLVRRAQRTGMAPDEYAKQVVEGGHVPVLVSEVVRGKALAHLVDTATVRDASGRPVELKRLQPDGTIADESQSADGSAGPDLPAHQGSDSGDVGDSSDIPEGEAVDTGAGTVEGAGDRR